MTLVLKIERALAFAKEVGLNDKQVKDLMAMILDLPNFQFEFLRTQPAAIPITQPSPWMPQYPNDTIICTPPTVSWNCSCSPIGQYHSDDCKALGINQ